MSRAKLILQMFEEADAVESPKISYKVREAGDPPHAHQHELDSEGNGKLLPEQDHEHEVKGWEVQPAGQYPHIHEIVKEEVMPPSEPTESYVLSEQDKQWDDEVSDTKEKVKVTSNKLSPTVRRVFDKEGKYMGSFDLRKNQDKNKYKTMFRGGK